ncbi:MAG: hypothetical protein IRY99_16180 [Isosphaeraceae bacterium]|nr:hypothetical protein [Isosphaeraceae bacterium]
MIVDARLGDKRILVASQGSIDLRTKLAQLLLADSVEFSDREPLGIPLIFGGLQPRPEGRLSVTCAPVLYRECCDKAEDDHGDHQRSEPDAHEVNLDGAA